MHALRATCDDPMPRSKARDGRYQGEQQLRQVALAGICKRGARTSHQTTVAYSSGIEDRTNRIAKLALTRTIQISECNAKLGGNPACVSFFSFREHLKF